VFYCIRFAVNREFLQFLSRADKFVIRISNLSEKALSYKENAIALL